MGDVVISFASSDPDRIASLAEMEGFPCGMAHQCGQLARLSGLHTQIPLSPSVWPSPVEWRYRFGHHPAGIAV